MPADAPSLDDVLAIEYPGAPEWVGDGSALVATVYEDDGNAALIADGAGGDPWRFTPETGHVAEVAASPVDDRVVIRSDEGALFLTSAADRTAERIAHVPTDDTAFEWSTDGTAVAYYHEGTPWVRDLEAGSERGFDVPERGPYLGEARMFAWDDGDDRLAYRFVDDDVKQLGVIDLASGDLRWRTRGGRFSCSNPAWLDDGRLLFERTGNGGTVRQFVAADPGTDEETVLLEDRDEERGVVSGGEARVAPDRGRFAVALPLDGWDHIYVVGLDGDVTQLTEGAFEDKGLAGSSPRWLDTETVVFASNRRDPGQRHLFAVDLEGDVRPLVDAPGTNVHPRPSPGGDRLAYVHADRERSPEVRVIDLDAGGDGDPRRVTGSRVDEWPVTPVPPEHVTYAGAEGETVHAYLLDPRRSPRIADDADGLPAVVYVHGGPMRQMRDGWHPSRSYGIAYAFHQYLAHRGYVGLFVNYRGGIGYGRAFRQALAGHRGDHEIVDIVRAAEYLTDLQYVDGEAVGTWGLSYGGYTTLQVLGTHPAAFDVGINLAGLADLEQYREWAHETKYPAAVSSMDLRLGGPPWEAPENWAAASPKTHMTEYEAPLYSFHGTDDSYVDFEQLDVVVDRLLELDKEFTAEYYPEESHVFGARAAWRHTFRKIERAFEEHLGGADGSVRCAGRDR